MRVLKKCLFHKNSEITKVWFSEKMTKRVRWTFIKLHPAEISIRPFEGQEEQKKHGFSNEIIQTAAGPRFTGKVSQSGLRTLCRLNTVLCIEVNVHIFTVLNLVWFW